MYFKSKMKRLNDLFRKNHKLDIKFRNEIIRILCSYAACEDVEDTELAWTDDQIFSKVQAFVDYQHYFHDISRVYYDPISGEPLPQRVESEESEREQRDEWRRWALDNIS
jgi:hypothetical protein